MKPTPSKEKKAPSKSNTVAKSKKAITTTELKKTPNFFFLGLAGAAVVGSALLSLSNNGKRKFLGHFIGLWVPPLITLGLYNKVAQVENAVLDVVKH